VRLTSYERFGRVAARDDLLQGALDIDVGSFAQGKAGHRLVECRDHIRVRRMLREPERDAPRFSGRRLAREIARDRLPIVGGIGLVGCRGVGFHMVVLETHEPQCPLIESIAVLFSIRRVSHTAEPRPNNS